jgi:glycosyltransferase involved in cell wall biosynthesis
VRVALVTHQFFPSFYTGIERLTLNLANQLRRMGHTAVVITSADNRNGGRPTYAVDGIEVLPVDGGQVDLGRPWLQDPSVTSALERIFAEEDVDVVHVMHPMRLPQAFDAAERRRVPVVAHLADFGYLCARLNMVRSDGTICESAEHGDACVRVCGVSSGPERVSWGQGVLSRACAVISPCRFTIRLYARNGFDTSGWHYVPWGVDYALHPARLPSPRRDELVIGFVGTLLRHKGPHVVVEALRSRPELPVELDLYGGSFHEAKYEAELRALAGGDSRIRFRGSYVHEEFHGVLAQFDAVVIPSIWHENLPTVGLSAVAAGLPLVVSDVGGLLELIDDYSCGLSFPVGEPESLGDLLEHLASERERLEHVRTAMAYPPSLEEEAWRVEHIYETAVGVAR